jgi:hypothetical protein
MSLNLYQEFAVRCSMFTGSQGKIRRRKGSTVLLLGAQGVIQLGCKSGFLGAVI